MRIEIGDLFLFKPDEVTEFLALVIYRASRGHGMQGDRVSYKIIACNLGNTGLDRIQRCSVSQFLHGYMNDATPVPRRYLPLYISWRLLTPAFERLLKEGK
jgi:hypothetical protein